MTAKTVKFCLESLKYARLAFMKYKGYPNEDFRRERLAECDAAMAELRALRKQRKTAP